MHMLKIVQLQNYQFVIAKLSIRYRLPIDESLLQLS